MIADTLKNSFIYSPISEVFKTSFEFINSLNKDTPNGEYWIAEGLKAIVMEYETMAEFQFGYEAHRKYIDIQYCLRGKERIKWTPLSDELTPSIEYDSKHDRTFYTGKGENTFIDTGDGIFAIFFPEDAHAPQMYIDKPRYIKKVVVKVPVNSIIK
jgi:YhcH/YjgK/YiaL family protein